MNWLPTICAFVLLLWLIATILIAGKPTTPKS